MFETKKTIKDIKCSGTYDLPCTLYIVHCTVREKYLASFIFTKIKLNNK